MTVDRATVVAIATGTFGVEDNLASPDPSILVRAVRADAQSLAGLAEAGPEAGPEAG